jgi:hypothetical protein
MNNLELIEAVKNGNYTDVEMLIKKGADVNQQDEQGWTPLNFAAGKGDISLVQLLVNNGADIFKIGRDRRTPYMIALAAERVSVVKYLKEMEDKYQGEKPEVTPREYCKAYYLKELRKYPPWSESRINWKGENDNNNVEEDFADDKIVFLHQDLTVTLSAWHNENIIFNNVDSAWEEFCANTLKFKVPTDLDLITPNDSSS